MRSTAVLIAFVLLQACGPEEQPQDLIDRETFITLMVEAQLIEARTQHEIITGHRVEGPLGEYYAQLFTAHGVTQERFRRTFDHYAADPATLKDIYDEVYARLVLRKDAGEETAP